MIGAEDPAWSRLADEWAAITGRPFAAGDAARIARLTSAAQAAGLENVLFRDRVMRILAAGPSAGRGVGVVGEDCGWLRGVLAQVGAPSFAAGAAAEASGARRVPDGEAIEDLAQRCSVIAFARGADPRDVAVAAAAGVAVLAEEALRDAVGDGPTFLPRDPAAWAVRIRRVLYSPEERARLRRAGAAWVRHAVLGESGTDPVVAVLCNWGEVCGIAQHSEYIVRGLWQIGFPATVLSSGATAPRVVPCWQKPLRDPNDVQRAIDVMRSASARILHVQYDQVFFDTRLLRLLLRRAQEELGVRTILDMHHSTEQSLATFDRAVDQFVTHQPAFSGPRVDCLPLSAPVAPACDRDEVRRQEGIPDRRWVCGFGFVGYYKGTLELVDAVESLRGRMDVGLLLIGTKHPNDRSDYAARVMARVAPLEWVRWYNEFMVEDRLIRMLQAADVVAMPYTIDSPSISGAAKLALASRRPVLVSRSSMFADLSSPMRVDPKPDAIAATLAAVLSDDAAYETARVAVEEELERYLPDRVAEQYAAVYRRLAA